MENVTGDLFVGEAKLFFAHSRRQWRLPYRIETAAIGGSASPVSFAVHTDNPDLIAVCDTRMDARRVVRALCTTDIGVDTGVSANDPDNAGRWTNLRETSDGRHWTDGEHYWKRMLDAKPETATLDEEEPHSTLSRLTAQLPPHAVEAVRDGRAVLISRTKNIVDYLAPRSRRTVSRDTAVRSLSVRRVCKSYGNHVYALHGVSARDHHDGETVALLFVGRFWPKDASTGGGVRRPPPLIVARTRSLKEPVAGGGRVFCICLGGHLTRTLDGLTAEDVTATRRHYEGYFNDDDTRAFTSVKCDE